MTSADIREEDRRHMTAVRRAIDKRRVLTIRYRDKKDVETTRDVRPLGLFHWSGSWSMAAWCETREDHRNFRLDQCLEMTTLPRTFTDESPWTLEDFLNVMQRH